MSGIGQGVKKVFQTGTEFYQATLDRLHESQRKRETDAIRRSLAGEERVRELKDIATRGSRAEKWLADAFWREDFEPLIRSLGVLKPAKVKDGEPAPVDRINVEFLIGSGAVRVTTKIIETLDDWVKQGREATKILELEAKKRQELRMREAEARS